MAPRHLAVALFLLALTTTGEAGANRHVVSGGADLSWYRASSELGSWLYRGSGKLRYDERHDGIRFNRFFLEYRGALGDEFEVRTSLNVNNDVSERVEILETFFEWRPVPSSPWRFRARAGAFYPRMSLENVDDAWSNAYALSSSVINTWIGEELRAIGLELKASRSFGDWQQIGFEATLFGFNDPTGAALAWRGWTAHDRQTGINASIPMPAISAIEPWNSSGAPIAKTDPFREIDDRPGFYVGSHWRYGRRVLLKFIYYDNNADPEATAGDDYAWDTQFNHVAAQVALPWQLGFLFQTIDGSSVMGPDLGPWHVQDIKFDASYVLLTREFGRNRLTVRFDWFDIQPTNDPAGVTNQDKGDALTFAWLRSLTDSLRLGAEYLHIATTHCATESCAWIENGLPRKTRERQWQITLRLSF